MTDLAGNALDGEFDNPTDGSDPSSDTYLTAGDGAAGGDFHFRFDVLPGDATGDGAVDPNDLASLLAGFARSNRLPAQGEFTGDGRVDRGDLQVLQATLGRSLPAAAPDPNPGGFGFFAGFDPFAAMIPTVLCRQQHIPPGGGRSQYQIGGQVFE